MPFVGPVVSLLLAAAALIAWLIRFSTRISTLETDVKALKDQMISQKEWGELHHQVKTLWEINVMEELRKKKQGM